MIPEDRAKIFAALATAFPSWKPEPKTFEVYSAALLDVPTAALRRAVVLHLRRSKFPPTVAELRELAVAPDDRLSAEEAWQCVRSQIRSVGSYRSPTLDPASARAVDALGGWQTLCGTETSQMGFMGAHFMRCYAAYTGKADKALEYERVSELLGERPREIEEGAPTPMLEDGDLPDTRPADALLRDFLNPARESR